MLLKNLRKKSIGLTNGRLLVGKVGLQISETEIAALS